jgi:hypothetical protein
MFLDTLGFWLNSAASESINCLILTFKNVWSILVNNTCALGNNMHYPAVL